MEKDCVVCGLKYFATRYKQTQCSGCTKFQKGHKPWNEGVHGYLSKEVIERASKRLTDYIKNETKEQRASRMKNFLEAPRVKNMLGKVGDKCPHWKDEEANYNSKHKWIQKHWTKTGKCEDCGRTPIPNPLKRLKVGTYWHNPTKTYRRERSEWMEVCAVCHYKLDHK